MNCDCEECKKAFHQGYIDGSHETYERAYPDVGFRFNKEEKDYWEKYIKGE